MYFRKNVCEYDEVIAFRLFFLLYVCVISFCTTKYVFSTLHVVLYHHAPLLLYLYYYS